MPLGLVDRTSLLGPVERVAERLQALSENGATTVNVSPSGNHANEKINQLRLLMDAAQKAGIR